MIGPSYDALDYLVNINRNKYNSDHSTYVKYIQKILWQQFDNWIGFTMFGDSNEVHSGEGRQYYSCKNKNSITLCIFDSTCTNRACDVFGFNSRRIANVYISGNQDDAAKSLSDFTGFNIESSDFTSSSKEIKVIQPGGQTISYVNCEFVDFSLVFPNPLDYINSTYLDNAQYIIDKINREYKSSPVESYYSILPLVSLIDSSNSMKNVTDEVQKFQKEEKKEKILSIISYVFLGLSIIAAPFGAIVNTAVEIASLIATTVASLKLTGKVSTDSLVFGIIAIIQPFIKFPSSSIRYIFKTIDLNDVKKLNGKFQANKKYEDIISSKIKPNYCKK